ncbi:unnamed protein product, partial [Darwinula stevensoni]
MMTKSYTFLCASILSLIPSVIGHQYCPDWKKIINKDYTQQAAQRPVVQREPCRCTKSPDGDVTVDCSKARTGWEIREAFHDASWPSTQLWRFEMRSNTDVDVFPENAFQSISFESIYMYGTVVKAIDPSAVLASKDKLVRLEILFSRLEGFPVEILPQLPGLRDLDLSNNRLTSVPALQSQSLEELYLQSNNISRLEEAGWVTPKLRMFFLYGNPLSVFPSAVIKSLERLEEFRCGECNLGPILSSGLIEFRSQSLKAVSFSGNGISRVEPGAIAGLTPNTSVSLQANEIAILHEESFRPILEVLSKGNGVLSLGEGMLTTGVITHELGGLTSSAVYVRVLPASRLTKETCWIEDRVRTDSGQQKYCWDAVLVDASDKILCSGAFIERQFVSTTASCFFYNSIGNSSAIDEVGGRNYTECVEHGKYVIGSIVTYACNQHYILRGSRIRTCTENGQWTGHVPFCEPECGRRVQPVALSAGGTPSDIGEWPWQVAIYDTKRAELICGGALIREQWVLTAAHCLTVAGTSRIGSRNDFLFYLGKHHRNNSLDDEFVQEKKASKIILQEDFSLQNFDSDIAIVKLMEPAVLTKRVQLICLPTLHDLSERNLQNGSRGWVAAWGFNGSDILSHVLTEVEIPVKSNPDCRRDTMDFTHDPSLTRTLTSNMFCAGHDKDTPLEAYQSVCPGDSGSPMVFHTHASLESRWQVEGIVSHFFSREACSMRRPGQYGIFTKVNRKFKMDQNTNVVELPEGALQNVSFERMNIRNSAVKTIHPSALLSSAETLSVLEIFSCHMESFPFDVLPRLTKLRALILPLNRFASVPPLRSGSLEELFLMWNKIMRLEKDGWATPKLRKLVLDGNPFSEFPSDVISGLERLEEFSCAECNLGPSLPSGFLNFRSETLKVVNLAWNKIARLESGAITGLTLETNVDLQHNNIAIFPKESFHAILQVLSRGSGILNVNSFSPEGGTPVGNTIQCDCHAEWLANDRLFKSIGGKCRNGIEFQKFSWNELECLQPCPYSCVQIGFFPLCNPETVILSKVEGCRSQELCCQPNFQSIAAAKTTTPRPTDCGLTPRPDVRTGNETEKDVLVEGETVPGSWPWTAALKTKDGEFVCGGTLVNSHSVLTAAHCVYMYVGHRSSLIIVLNLAVKYKTASPSDVFRRREDPGSFYVSLGDHDRLEPEAGQLDVKIRQIVIHPAFDIDTLRYDLAVVLLDNPAPFLNYPNIRPICLPKADERFDEAIREGVVVGWGLPQRGGLKVGPLSRKEKMTIVHIFPPEICSKVIGSLYDEETMICASSREGRVCNGDGGAGLATITRYTRHPREEPSKGRVPAGANEGACSRSPVFTLAGVTSWAKGSCDPKIPSGYVRLSGTLSSSRLPD